MLRGLCIILTGQLAMAIGAAQNVDSRDGSIYFTDRNHHSITVTNGGTDTSPSLSADDHKVVYVRSYPSKEDGSDGLVSEIRIHDLVTGTDSGILKGPLMIDKEKYFGFGFPQFSADSNKIYFLIDWSVATRGIAAVDIRSREIHFVLPAITFSSVLRGKYAGNLVARQRRPKLSGGYYYLYYLFTPNAQELGVVGDSEFDVGLFLDPDGSR